MGLVIALGTIAFLSVGSWLFFKERQRLLGYYYALMAVIIAAMYIYSLTY